MYVFAIFIILPFMSKIVVMQPLKGTWDPSTIQRLITQYNKCSLLPLVPLVSVQPTEKVWVPLVWSVMDYFHQIAFTLTN